MTMKRLTILAALLFAACAQNAPPPASNNYCSSPDMAGATHTIGPFYVTCPPLPQAPEPQKAESREEAPTGMLGCWSGTLRGKSTRRVTAVTAERDQLFTLCFDPAPRCLAQPPEGVAGYHCEVKVTSAGLDWVELVTHSTGHNTGDLTFL
jgi:hypothetical protein